MATVVVRYLYTKVISWSARYGASYARAGAALACLVFAAASGALPASSAGYAYGYLMLRDGEPLHDSPLRVVTGSRVAPVQNKAYLAQLEALEATEGPYGASLSETLADLARYHEARGENAQALRLYRRALHLLRVNEGLNSPGQVPLVRAELGLHQKLGDLESLDDRYEYYFRLLGAGRAPLTNLRVTAALSYLRWQREALRQGMFRGAEKRILNALALNDELLELVRQSAGLAPGQAVDDEIAVASKHWLSALTLSQINNLYVLQEFFPPREEDEWLTSSRYGSASAEQPSFEDYVSLRVQRLRRVAASTGSALLEQGISELSANSGVAEQAQLTLALGDWYQWYGLRFYAAEQYRRARKLLLSAGEKAVLEASLSEPVELPANGVFRRFHTPGPDAQPPIQLRFDVSATGRANNIEIIETPEGAERSAQKIARALRSVRFRPRWVNGEAEAVQGLERGYHRLQ